MRHRTGELRGLVYSEVERGLSKQADDLKDYVKDAAKLRYHSFAAAEAVMAWFLTARPKIQEDVIRRGRRIVRRIAGLKKPATPLQPGDFRSIGRIGQAGKQPSVVTELPGDGDKATVQGLGLSTETGIDKSDGAPKHKPSKPNGKPKRRPRKGG